MFAAAAKRGGWMPERPPVLTFEVAVTSIVESNRVNIDYAAALVRSKEAPLDATRQAESVVVENIGHATHAVISHDEVEVLVLAGLLADQSVYFPATVEPDGHTGVS
jgi:hypothetical protein